MDKKIDVVLFGAILPPIDFRITAGSFPLGLLALASVLKQKGFSVKVISGAFPNAEKKLEESLKNCRYFGVSSMTGPYLKMAILVSKAVRKRYPHIPIIWGGVHSTLLPEETIKHNYVDIIVRGIGEETLCRLIEALDGKLSLNNVRGITYKENNKIMSTPDAEKCDINKFPASDYSYFLPYKNDIDEIGYMSSRGCPFSCTFCVASKLYQHKYYAYSAERVFKEVKALINNFSCKKIVFWDDNFFVVKDRLKNFCQLLIESELKIKWRAFCHCDSFLRCDDDLLHLMKKSGLDDISFGAESGSPKILNLIKKKVTTEQITSSLLKTTKFNLNTDFTFMTGFPGETLDDFNQTLGIFKKLLKINPDVRIRLFAFTPYPKIPLLEQNAQLLKYFPNTIEGWANLTYQTYIPEWISYRHKKLINNIVWMTSFLSRKQRPTAKNPFFNVILYLYHLSAILRLNHNLLLYAFEWKLFKSLSKAHTKISQNRLAKWVI